MLLFVQQETHGEELQQTTENKQITETIEFKYTEPDDYVLLFDYYNNTLIYEMATADDRVRIYPEDTLDQIDLKEFREGRIILSNLGNVVEEYNFVKTFSVDTTKANFTYGTFTSIAEGSALYKCNMWNNSAEQCDSAWKFIVDLEEGKQYTEQLPENENAAYGELYIPFTTFTSEHKKNIVSQESWQNGIGIASKLGILSAINSTSAGGLLAYVPDVPGTTFNYRTWNLSSGNFTGETTESQTFTGTIEWTVVRANHERDEFIMGTLNGANDCEVIVYNAANNDWHNYTLLTSTCENNAARRSIDIAYEDVSGDALVVFDQDSTTTGTTMNYTIWNGSAFGAQQSITTEVQGGRIRWIQAIPKIGTDHIMVLGLTSQFDIFARLWNGTDFESAHNVTLTTTLDGAEPFHFAWESKSGDGLVAYGVNALNVDLQTYDYVNKVWSGAIVNAIDIGGQEAQKIRLCSDSNSDDIGIIVQDSGADVSVRIWNGATIETTPTPPIDDLTTEASATSAMNIDCEWNSEAIFMFVDGALSVDHYLSYVTYNQSAWSQSDLENANLSSQIDPDSASLKDISIDKNPVTDEIMIMVIDSGNDLNSIIYNSSWSVIYQTIDASLECTSVTDCAQFAWSKYDTVPNVTAITPSGTNFALSATINITANVTDNIHVDVVLANITLPNGTINQILLTNLTDKVYNSTFSNTADNGIYTIRIIANDTSLHKNVNSSETVTFTVGDFLYPNITNITPTAGTNYSLNTTVNISADITDDFGVSVVMANITFPNGTIGQFTLTNKTNVTYNMTFSTTTSLGVYVVRIIANDTSNNVNNSEITNFSIGDVNSPSVTNITPTAGTNYNENTSVNITVDITDNIGISSVSANITLPNETVIKIALTNRSAETYNATFNATSLIGIYHVRIIANDTSNNINSTETTNFSIGDVIAPSITLNSPADDTNTTSTSVTFNFTVTDNIDTNLNCSIRINSVISQTNSTTPNNTATLFPISGFSDGPRTWNITCNDDSPNNITSSTRTFRIDTTVPQFNSLTNSPSSSADLDPSVIVNISANVTDNVTSVNTVIFQRKLNNESDSSYVNITMTYNSTTLLYNASFNATQNGTYNMRLFANDSLGNKDISNHVNFTVEFDRTWTRTPAIFPAVVANSSKNAEIGDLTINNTGDFGFIFNITSNSTTTSYNGSSDSGSTNFTLAAGTALTLQVNDTAPIASVKTITLNISVNDSLASPLSLTTTANIVVASGQPVLVATFSIPSTDTLSVTQGDTARSFIATLYNFGEGNASNVTFFMEMPSEWEITFGAANVSFNELNSGENETNIIEVTIPSNATSGIFTVTANATGVNASGNDLNNERLIFVDTVSVTVESAVGILGSIGGGEGISVAPSVSAPSVSAGGGGGASERVIKTQVGPITQIIETTELFSVPRGSGATTPITIVNLWENANMQNISLNVSGFLSQYVVLSSELNRKKAVEITAVIGEQYPIMISGMEGHTLSVNEIQIGKVTLIIESEPKTIDLKEGQIRYVDLDGDSFGDLALELLEIIGDTAAIRAYPVKDYSQVRLAHGEMLNYYLDIYAPSYMVQRDYDLELKIYAKLISTNATAAGFTQKAITELRTLLFHIQEVGAEDALKKLKHAREDVTEMKNSVFNIEHVQELLAQAEEAYRDANYDLVKEIVDQIAMIHKEAFDSDQIIQQVKGLLEKSKDSWLATPQTEEVLQLALIAFDRGDYTTALERAKNTQLIFVLETKGRINIIKFVIDWWMILLLGAIVLTVISYISYKRAYIAIIEQRLRNLDKEENTIQELLEETQKKYIKDNLLSEAQYLSYTKRYEKRLMNIRKLRAKLRNRRVAIIKTEQDLENIQKEKEGIKELLEKNQTDYLVKGKLSRKKFIDNESIYKERLAEIEREESILEDKLAKQKETRWYNFIYSIKNMYPLRNIKEHMHGGNEEKENKKKLKEENKEQIKKENKKQIKKEMKKELKHKYSSNKHKKAKAAQKRPSIIHRNARDNTIQGDKQDDKIQQHRKKILNKNNKQDKDKLNKNKLENNWQKNVDQKNVKLGKIAEKLEWENLSDAFSAIFGDDSINEDSIKTSISKQENKARDDKNDQNHQAQEYQAIQITAEELEMLFNGVFR